MATDTEKMNALQEYIDEYKKLEAEYWQIKRIPIYHLIMQMINIEKRGKLTRDYSKKMKEWGIIE